jgi:hypothetical protein
VKTLFLAAAFVVIGCASDARVVWTYNVYDATGTRELGLWDTQKDCEIARQQMIQWKGNVATISACYQESVG